MNRLAFHRPQQQRHPLRGIPLITTTYLVIWITTFLLVTNSTYLQELWQMPQFILLTTMTTPPLMAIIIMAWTIIATFKDTVLPSQLLGTLIYSSMLGALNVIIVSPLIRVTWATLMIPAIILSVLDAIFTIAVLSLIIRYILRNVRNIPKYR